MTNFQLFQRTLDPFLRDSNGIEKNVDYLDYGIRRRLEINDPNKAEVFREKMSENPDESMVMVNHVRKELKDKMIEKGLCYLRTGESKGSLLVVPGFERLQYVLLHTGGQDCKLFKLKHKGSYKIWSADTLRQYGFAPEHAPYYIVLSFDNKRPIEIINMPNLKERTNTFRPKIMPVSEFIGIN